MKYIKLLIIIIIIIALLAGCRTDNPPPESTPTPDQTATGGVPEPAENVNVKDIDILQKGDSTVITISMLSGSRQNGYNESKLAELPEYEITLLEKPERLKITLDHISFWDYEPKESWELSNFVVGLFREVPADNDKLILYVQLTQNATFTYEQIDGDLVITLTPGEMVAAPDYFCVADGFLEHQDGTWPDSIEMQPVLCSDGINKLLISQPFNSESEAMSFAAQKNIVLQNIIKDKEIYVVSLQAGTLPSHEHSDGTTSLEDYSVVLSQDVVVKTPPILENGKYLASSKDGRIAFSRRYKPEEPSLEQDVYLYSDKVWILDPNGRMTELDVPEFFSVEKAAFSSDGTLLAILDVSIENSVLYVYDFEKGEPYNLGEEGFGSLTYSFVWSDTKNTLYAMTGSDEASIQLKGCDFEEENRNIYAVEEKAGGPGSLDINNDGIYFADRTVHDGGSVYKITDTRRQQICTGVDIKISDTDNNMLVLESYASGGEERTTNLKLCDIETTECRYIAQNVDIENYAFSYNFSKVFYTVPAKDPVDEYLYEFVSYDIVTGVAEVVALTSTSHFEVSSQPGEIYFIKEIVDNEQANIATFVYNFNKGE